MHHFEASKRHQSRTREMDVSQTHPLEFIIRRTPHILVNVLHDTHHPTRSTPFTHPQCKSIFQPFDRALSLERRKSGIEHQPNGVNELIGVRSQSEERLDGQTLKHAIIL